MPRENRNPPKQLTGPQGMTTLLTESNDRFARLEEKIDALNTLISGLVGEIMSLARGKETPGIMAQAIRAELERLLTTAAEDPAEDTKAETKPAKADGKKK